MVFDSFRIKASVFGVGKQLQKVMLKHGPT